MSPNVFIYIVTNLLVLQLTSLESHYVDLGITILCLTGIVTLGVGHGAIDHILYGTPDRKSNIKFITRYLFIAIVFAVLWYFVPSLAFGIFILISAYHFGQSQFTEYNFGSKILSKSIYMSWGLVVLFCMLYFTRAELLSYQSNGILFPSLLVSMVAYADYIFFSSLAVILSIWLVLVLQSKISWHSFFKEIYILVLIGCSMFLFPVFIGFSLFFIWIHSYKVIHQEYAYCKEHLQVKKIQEFAKLFIPLGLSSLAGITFVVLVMISYENVSVMPYVLLVLLSCVTVPHSFVMDKFYSHTAPAY